MQPPADESYENEVNERFKRLPSVDPPTRENTLILIPTMDGRVDHLLTQGLLQSTHLYGGIGWLPCCSDIAYARNRLLGQFMRSPFQWAVMIDSDTGFTAQDLVYLLEGNDYAVTGIYSKKDQQGTVVTQGLGFARVHRCVLEAIQATPNLGIEFARYNERLTGFCWSGPTGIDFGYLGEDQAFWFLVSQIGVTPRLETRVRLKHVGRAEYGIEELSNNVQLPRMAPEVDETADRDIGN